MNRRLAPRVRTMTDEECDRRQFEKAVAWAWVLWHSGLTAASVFRVLAELLRRNEPRSGAAVSVLISQHGVTVKASSE